MPYNPQEVIRANVERCGLSVFGIGGDKDSPGFVYTVGFAKHGLPEVIVFSLPPQMIMPLINQYYDEIVNQKVRDAGPCTLNDWFNLPMAVINADREKAAKYAVQGEVYAANAGWDKPQYVQWVWSDANGHLPWEEGFDHARFDAAQPLLVVLS